ncbi:MAG: choice-of-anchor tandem repeat GloVer-containing protein [Rhizomicrobium sp.]|jgi:uncharacterized repeat protein (TIGR03803 family)
MRRLGLLFVTGITSVIAAVASCECTSAASFSILHSFAGPPSDGAFPYFGGVAFDAAGNIYGTTLGGGESLTMGTVFEIAPDGSETVLYSFTGLKDGGQPEGSVVLDAGGNIYGMTTVGGSGYGTCAGGCGVVFELVPGHVPTILHSFGGAADGQFPYDTPILDSAGTLYGTTKELGPGCGGTVFTIKNGKYSIVYGFPDESNGCQPQAGVIKDSSGNLYGTTLDGGIQDCDGSDYACGTVFEVAPDGTGTALHMFQHEADGAVPQGGLARDASGNLYGTTWASGTTYCGGKGCGVVFKIAPDGTFTTLHAFLGPTHKKDGSYPTAGVVLDKSGNLYGTTSSGGAGCPDGNFSGCGTIFEISKSGKYKVLHRFSGNDGETPLAPLLERNGKLYGTTEMGGAIGFGTVFVIKP